MTVAARLAAGIVAAAAWCGTALAHEDLQERIDALTRAIARAGDAAPLLLQRAELHRLHRDWDAAARDLDAVATRPAVAPELDLARARLAIDRGDDALAARHLDRLLAAQPDSAVGLDLRADLAERGGRHAESARDRDAAIRHSPEPRIEQYQRWSAALAAGGDTAAAVAALDAGIARFGPIVSLEHPAVERLVAARRWDDALARLDGMLARTGPRELLLTWRAEVLLAAGRAGPSGTAFRLAQEAWAQLPQRARERPAMQSLLARISDGAAAAQRGGIASSAN